MKFLIIQFSPASCTASFLRPNSLFSIFSQIISIYVLPLGCEIKFHFHTKQQVKLYFCIIYLWVLT